MNNIFINALCVCLIYGIIKFFETRFILKEKIILKKIVIDSLIVYFSVILGYFIIDQFYNNKAKLMQAPVFIDNPNF